MDRRTLVTAVGAVVLTVAAASSAVAVNLGILDDPRPAPGDRFVQSTSAGSGADASGATDEPEVVRIQVRDLPPTGAPSTTKGATGTTGTTGTTGAAAPAPAPTATTAAPAEDHDDDHEEHSDVRPGGRTRERHDDDDD